MKKNFLLILSILLINSVFAQTETEPNNSIVTADAVTEGVVFSGAVGSTDNDYFKSMPVDDGTIKVYLTFTSSDPTADIFFYANARNGGSLGTSYQYNHSTISGTTDTISINCRQRDSLYIRVQGSGGTSSYTIRYERLVPAGPNDSEPNNSFADAILVNFNAITKGRVGYKGIDGTDDHDYYKTVMPEDGSFEYIVDYNNPNDFYGNFFSYINTSSGSSLGTNYSYSRGAGNWSDTIRIHCRKADTFYIRIQSTNCFSYSFRTRVYNVTGTDDAEPNNTRETSTLVAFSDTTKGRIGYKKLNSTDGDDYYRTVMPEDGSFEYIVDYHNPNDFNGNLFSYINTTSGSSLGTNYSYNRAKGNWSDTIRIHCRKADTFYIRIQSTNCFSYSFRTRNYNVTGTDDAEPNNSRETSILVGFSDTTNGRVGYKKINTTDGDDYYRTVMPEDGSFEYIIDYHNPNDFDGNMFSYINTSAGASLGTSFSYNRPNGSWSDTIQIHCRKADTFYIRIQSTNCFSYSFRTRVYNVTGTDDAEPNNTAVTATLINTADTVKGRIGYKKLSTVDGDDFFKFPNNQVSKITAYVSYDNTNISAANFFMYFNRISGGSLGTRYQYNAASGVSKDTIVLNCVPQDTIVMRIQSTGCFSYDVVFKVESEVPLASMEHERMGNTIGFRPQFSNSDDFSWDFGDGTTSTLKYPKHTYSSGYFFAKLIASNSLCNMKDTAITEFEVKGLEYYTPRVGGTGGDVVMKIFGGGLDTATSVRLIKGGVVLKPVQKYTNGIENQLLAVFDLHFAEGGTYDVEIGIPGEPIFTETGGFFIDTFRYPETWSDIQGPSRVRPNRVSKYNLVVGNKGNVMASGVVVAVVWPKDADVVFKDNIYRPESSDYDTLSVTTDDGEVYTLPREDYMFIYDSIQTITPIDSFEGEAYDGYIWHLIVPHVPANSTIEFPFTATTSSVTTNNFYTYTFKPNLFGSGAVPNYEDFQGDVTGELCDAANELADKSKVPLLKAFTVTAKIGQKHAGSASSYYGKKFWAWYDGYEFDEGAAMADLMRETEANNAFAIQTAKEELIGLLFDAAVAKNKKLYEDQIDFINKRLANNKTMSPELVEKYLDILNNQAGDYIRADRLEEMFKIVKKAGDESKLGLKIQEAVTKCPELKKQEQALKDYAGQELHHKGVRRRTTSVLTSWDPNEIIGPDGAGADGYVLRENLQNFVILFENKAEAGASAQIVMITDTLDKSKFDLTTFEFGSVAIGTEDIKIPKSRFQFVQEYIQSDSMHVRINGELDTLTGIITWQFTAIDPVTNDLPDFNGFLPPNTIAPQGEGSVSYSIKPVSTLADGTVITNKASIIFDDNKPIITNIWKNIVDVLPPSSTVSATRIGYSDTIVLTYSGADASSGVAYYDLYIKTDDGEWIVAGGSNGEADILVAPLGHTYHFYVSAHDQVGNEESKSPMEEATVTLGVDDIDNDNAQVFVVPNPASSTIQVKGINEKYDYNIIDVLGKEVKSGNIRNSTQSIDIGSLHSGIYFIAIKGEDFSNTVKWIKSN